MVTSEATRGVPAPCRQRHRKFHSWKLIVIVLFIAYFPACDGKHNNHSSSSSTNHNSSSSSSSPHSRRKRLAECKGLLNTAYTENSWLRPSLVPLVFITRGRMGSTVTTDTLQRLANGFTTELNVHNEVMSHLPKTASPLDVAEEYFEKSCEANGTLLDSGWNPHNNIKARLVGFKWKVGAISPRWEKVITDFMAPNAVRAIVYSRNMVDWYISNGKHEVASSLAPHCATDDCVDKAESVRICVNVTKMMFYVKNFPIKMEAYASVFREYGVNYTSATWNDLYVAPDRVERWRYLLRFIGSPAAGALTDKRLERAIDFEATTKYDQRETVINYDELAFALKDTSYEHLLHGIPRFPRIGAELVPLATNPHCTPDNTY